MSANKAIRQDDGSYKVLVSHEIVNDTGTGWKEDMTVFVFQEVEFLRRTEINAFVLATIYSNDKRYVFSGRLNLSSLSAREGFARMLAKTAQTKVNFDSFLSQAIESLVEELNNAPRSTPVTEIIPDTGRLMLLDPFITDQSANIVFGDGGSTKSYMCIHMAISLASGLPFLGFKPSRLCNVLFLDYEDRGGKFSDRVYRVAGGMKEAPSQESLQKIHYMRAFGVPLADLVPSLKEEIARKKIDVLMIDSAAYACGAEIEKADAVIRYFNALDSLNVTSVAIAHVTKGSTEQENPLKGQKHAIGSIFFHNGVRNAWNVVKQGDDNDQEQIKKVCLFHRKCNDGVLHKFIPVEVDFSQPSVTKISPGKETDWEGARSVSGRILSVLHRGNVSRMVIDEELSDVDKNTIKVTLQRLKARGLIKQIGPDYFLASK